MSALPDISHHMGEIARRILGPPNDQLSTREQLRFGNNGSICIETGGSKNGTWYDYEKQIGGGPWQLLNVKGGMVNGVAAGWLKTELGINVEMPKPRSRPRIVATYDYRDEHGELLSQVCRLQPKDFRQRRPNGNGGWTWKVKGVRQVPYRRPELLASSPDATTFVAEGEKDADKLATLGLVSTCNAGGAGKWRREFAAFFRDRDVVVLPDNDDAGMVHARMVAANLAPVAKSVRIVEMPDLLPKGDVSDWLAAGGTREQFERLVVAAPLFQPSSDADVPSDAQTDWYSRCLTSPEGLVLGNVANALLALRHDPAWQGALAYDEMLRTAVLCRPVPRHDPRLLHVNPLFEPRPVRDTDVISALEWLQIAGIPTLSKDTTHSAVDLVALENSFHPVGEYLDALVWDGKDRLSSWLSQYLGADDNEYTRAIGGMFLISMVARIYQPGCQVDYMLILQGAQGAKKSSACQIIGGEWFSDAMPENLASKDASQHLRGKWLIELAELHALSRSEITALKAFLTRRVESYRPSYGRKDVHELRQVVFIGTTNKSVYLRDETGGRRFWPVTVGQIDLDLLRADRDQLLAEAVVRYHRGEHWWPTGEFEQQHIAPEQEARFEADEWEGLIAVHLDDLQKRVPEDQHRVTVSQVARDALSVDNPKLGTAEQRRIRAALGRLGWHHGARTSGARWWVPGMTQ
jgi:hypothetical protein